MRPVGHDGGMVAGEAAFGYWTGQMIGLSMRREHLPLLSDSPFGLLTWHWLVDFRNRSVELPCSLCGRPFEKGEPRYGIAGRGETGRNAMLLLCEEDYEPIARWLAHAKPQEGCVG